MLHKHKTKKRYLGFILLTAILLLQSFGPAVSTGFADEHLYALNLYTGRMTSNHWDDFLFDVDDLNFKDSYLIVIALARRIGKYQDKASFEIEGQIAKHFNFQTHWELNALAISRWEKFWWDDTLDTSVALGLGLSFATDEPELEVERDGVTNRFLLYWMLELALGLPEYPHVAVITRIHHRFNAFGLISDGGGSYALTLGLKWRF
jgi:hypothetical protein